jgi:hypothetical protein
MLATLSAENRALGMMRELSISNAFVSVLCKIEQTKLSYAFRGLKTLSNEEGLLLMKTLSRLIEIRNNVSPLTVDLKNPANARLLIEAFEGRSEDEIRESINALFQPEEEDNGRRIEVTPERPPFRD